MATRHPAPLRCRLHYSISPNCRSILVLTLCSFSHLPSFSLHTFSHLLTFSPLLFLPPSSIPPLSLSPSTMGCGVSMFGMEVNPVLPGLLRCRPVDEIRERQDQHTIKDGSLSTNLLEERAEDDDQCPSRESFCFCSWESISVSPTAAKGVLSSPKVHPNSTRNSNATDKDELDSGLAHELHSMTAECDDVVKRVPAIKEKVEEEKEEVESANRQNVKENEDEEFKEAKEEEEEEGEERVSWDWDGGDCSDIAPGARSPSFRDFVLFCRNSHASDDGGDELSHTSKQDDGKSSSETKKKIGDIWKRKKSISSCGSDEESMAGGQLQLVKKQNWAAVLQELMMSSEIVKKEISKMRRFLPKGNPVAMKKLLKVKSLCYNPSRSGSLRRNSLDESSSPSPSSS